MAIETAQGNLVMVGLNTLNPKVFWNGQLVDGIVGVQVNSTEGQKPSVTLKVKEQVNFAEMQSSGVNIRRIV